MKSTFARSSFLSFLILIFLTSCAAYQPAVSAAPAIINGDVQAVGPGAAKFIVDSALNAAPGSSIWFYGNSYLFTAPVAENMGFVALDAAGEAPIDICGGNIANCKTVTGLLAYLARLGWRQLATLPEYVVTLSDDLSTVMVTPVFIPMVSPYSPFETSVQ
jgi:hypothetical protein